MVLSTLFPKPNCPQLLDPHDLTVPSFNRNRVWLLPQETCLTLVRLGINVRVVLSIVSPKPNCPQLLSPQDLTVTSSNNTNV